MTYAEWLAAHVNKWGHPPSPGEAWAFAERQALERAAQVCDENIDPAEAAYEIRALMQDASNLTGKAREQWESDHFHRAIQDPEVCKMLGITPPSVARKEEPK